jgi:hypothetical protein
MSEVGLRPTGMEINDSGFILTDLNSLHVMEKVSFGLTGIDRNVPIISA